MGIFRPLSLGDSISSDPERTVLRRQGEKPGYIQVLQQRASSLNVIWLLLIKENQIALVKELRAFYVWEDARVWAHGNHFFLLHLSFLGPVSGVFHILSFLSSGLTIGSGCSPMAASSKVFFSFLSALRVHQLALEGCNHWWLWHLCSLMTSHVCVLSCVRLFTTPLTVDARFLCLWNFPGKNTGVGCHFLLQGVFLTQESTCLPCVSCVGRQILYHWAIGQEIFRSSTFLSFVLFYLLTKCFIFHSVHLVLEFIHVLEAQSTSRDHLYWLYFAVWLHEENSHQFHSTMKTSPVAQKIHGGHVLKVCCQTLMSLSPGVSQSHQASELQLRVTFLKCS